LSHAGIDEETIAQISDQIEDRRPIAMFEGITKGWAKDRRERAKLEKANARLEQKYSTIEQENALLKERLKQLEQNQPEQT
jgi:archaellum component FlaC